jgi:hypothetical protein
MGHNRSGVRARQRMRRHKKEMERLARKATGAQSGSAKAAAVPAKAAGR